MPDGDCHAEAENRTPMLDQPGASFLPLLRKVNGQGYISAAAKRSPASISLHLAALIASIPRAYPISSRTPTNDCRTVAPVPRPAEMIDILSVSIDAARPETYERLRTSGKVADPYEEP